MRAAYTLMKRFFHVTLHVMLQQSVDGLVGRGAGAGAGAGAEAGAGASAYICGPRPAPTKQTLI